MHHFHHGLAPSQSHYITPSPTSQTFLPSASSWAEELVARQTFVQSTHSTIVTVMPSLVVREEETDSGGGETDSGASMPTLVDTSSSSSSSISTTITAIPSPNNPYIHVPTLPTSLVFIIVGSILGALLLALTLYRIISHYIYSSKAQLEKEIYYSGPNLSEMSQHYSFPHKRMASSSSFLDLSSNSSTLSQGKSLQNHIHSDKQQFRKSMFNNPSLEYDSLSVPLYQDKRNSSSALYLQKYNNSSTASLMKPLGPYLDSTTVASSSYLDDGSNTNKETDSEKLGTTGTFAGSVQTTLRPPSMYLEDLLNGNVEKEGEDKGGSVENVEKEER
ncbi:hypothetical protein K4G60_g672 [Candida parapsilosis]|nr:hypothetical protein K4G60_g672 [Candida parapsilosis]KAI5906379.1 hypothetical protein K4G61_g36 [Candida parapsilosis]